MCHTLQVGRNFASVQDGPSRSGELTIMLHFHRRFQCYLLISLLLFSFACSRSPEAIRARSMAAGTSLMKKGDYRRAILEFKTAIQAMPRDPEAQYELGNAYIAMGDVASAALAYRRTTELNPKHAGAQQKLGELMAMLGDRKLVEEAEQRLHALVDAFPTDMTALNTLAFAELKLGKREDAIRHLEKVIAKAPERFASAALLAEAKLQNRDIPGAEEVLKTACARNPGSPDVFVVLGRFYTALDRLTEAEEQFQQALRVESKNAPALFIWLCSITPTGANRRLRSDSKPCPRIPRKYTGRSMACSFFRKTEKSKPFENLKGCITNSRTTGPRAPA